jgi:D-arabinose 1-dehydrogenase-like Zn-dependent alcohol dehydrogenase
MRAYAVHYFCELVVPIERSDPQPTGTEAVLEVTRCGICHTDLHLQDGYYDLGGGKRLNLMDRGIKPPIILGHEVLGRLLSKGAEAPLSEAEIGKTFLVYPWLGCGKCGGHHAPTASARTNARSCFEGRMSATSVS